MTPMVGMQAAGGEAATAVEPVQAAVIVAGMATALAASMVVAAWVARRMSRGLPVVEPRPHPAAAWRGGEVGLVALIYVTLAAASGAILGTDAAPRVQLAASMAVQAAATLAGIAVLRAAGGSWAALGAAGGRWREDAWIAAGGLGLVLAPLLGIAAALDRIVSYRHPLVTFLAGDRDPVAVALVVVAAVVVAPIAEEFFFRRALQGWLEARLPEADGGAAIGLSAAAFAAAHMGHGLAPAPLFLLGLVLGFIARRTGSLVPCILLHAGFNAVGVALLLASPPGPGAGM